MLLCSQSLKNEIFLLVFLPLVKPLPPVITVKTCNIACKKCKQATPTKLLATPTPINCDYTLFWASPPQNCLPLGLESYTLTSANS